MAFRVNHYNKKNGITYVYEQVSTWNKEKKQSVSKQVCIGKLDPITGEFVPSKRLNPINNALSDKNIKVKSYVIGPSLILDSITEELGIKKQLKRCFKEDHLKMLTLVYYLVHRGEALFHCENWSKSHIHPYGETLTSQEISRLLTSQSEDKRQDFFKEWSKVIIENEYLCYDITSVSSYSEQNEYVKYGYNRDKEDLPQINIAMLFGQDSTLPVYYKRMAGNITDVSTLTNFLKTIKFMDYGKVHLVLDRGFYSETNINDLFDAHHKFTIGVSTHLKWIQEILDEYLDEIQRPENYHKTNSNEVLYVNTRLYSWGKQGKRSYVHMYYNSHIAASIIDKFYEQLIECKEQLQSGNRIKKYKQFYDKYFIIKETPKKGLTISYNNENIDKFRNRYSGFFVLFTNDSKDPIKTLYTYRNKDVVENCFDDLKNQLDMSRLRVHGTTAMDSRIFMQFIALIYILALYG